MYGATQAQYAQPAAVPQQTQQGQPGLEPGLRQGSGKQPDELASGLQGLQQTQPGQPGEAMQQPVGQQSIPTSHSLLAAQLAMQQRQQQQSAPAEMHSSQTPVEDSAVTAQS